MFVLEQHLEIYNFKMIGENTIRIYDPVLTQQELSKKLVMNEVGIESINKKTQFTGRVLSELNERRRSAFIVFIKHQQPSL